MLQALVRVAERLAQPTPRVAFFTAPSKSAFSFHLLIAFEDLLQAQQALRSIISLECLGLADSDGAAEAEAASD